MISEKNAPRLLGAAFLFVFFASLISNVLLTSVVGSGNVSQDLVNVSNQLTRLRLSGLGQILTSSGIVVLAVLLYVVLSRVNRILALVALGWWLAEAITLALIQLGVLALIPLSLDFVRAGAPGESFYQGLGQFLYYGMAKQGMNHPHVVLLHRRAAVVHHVLQVTVHPARHLALGSRRGGPGAGRGRVPALRLCRTAVGIHSARPV